MGSACCAQMRTDNNDELAAQGNKSEQELISEDDFRIRAMTGDLILFKSNTMISKVQRKITNSEYDHVALVIRDRGELSEVFLLEAVGSGV